ncbi:sensor histidine kinase [Aquimarina aggregata]|uniref:sensor histidine kinase n=1 Tax=Aquimarina aggregata TaxID=1642818 RepID=UPI00248FA996|nr:histidine kinase [Aquimarina aggregata]
MSYDPLYLKTKKIEPIIHLVFWSMVFFFPYIKYFGREGGYSMSFAHEFNALFFYMVPSYVVYLWFLPLKNKKKYIPLIFLIFIGNALIHYYADATFHNEEGHEHHRWRTILSSLVTYLSFSLVFFTVHSVKKMYAKQLELDMVKQEKERAELKALKAQVNPHFLFNTLNTIYANTLKKDDKAPDLILKLSNNFRYVLHEGQKERVTIYQEIEHLKDYISLQKERLTNKIEVIFSEDIDNPKKQIAPLLLIPFVENAFKYTSVLKGKKHTIKIRLKIQDNDFSFYCENPRLDAQKEIETNWEESGIGIKNTQNRLQLLYPDQYKLSIEESEALFKVMLSIAI